MAAWRGWSAGALVLVLALVVAAGTIVPIALYGTARPPSPSTQGTPSPTPTISAGDPFWNALTLARLGLSKEAVEAAHSALPDAQKRQPAITLPPEIASLGAAPDDPFAAPKALARAGLDADAKTAFKKAVEEHPAATIPPDLAYLSDRPIRDWRGADIWIAGSVLLMNAAAVVAFLAAIFLVAWPVLRRIFLVRVQVGKFEGEPDMKIGEALQITVEDELLQLRREGGSSSLQLVRTPDAALAIPDPVKDLAPSIKLAAALVELIPSRIHVLSATLHPRGERGVGLTVAIADPRGRIRAGVTLWEEEFDPSYRPPAGDADALADAAHQAYQRLALAAASWAIYQPPLTPGDTLGNGYLSQDWRSYARHRVAVSWQDAGETEKARSLYFSALDADPLNAGALFNLAQVDGDNALERSPLSAVDQASFERARARAQEADRLLEQRKARRKRTSVEHDRFTYRVHYGLARLALHRALSDPAPADRLALLNEAEAEAFAVLRATNRYQSHPDKGSELDRFVRRIEDATVILLCGAWEELILDQEPTVPADAGYVLHRLITREAGDIMLVDPATRERDPVRVIRELAGDPDRRMGLDRQARYNLACYFCGQREPEQALKDLAYGLRPGLAPQARADPSLRAFRAGSAISFDHDRIVEFDQLVAQFDSPHDPTPTTVLARVGRIGSVFGARLAERQIKTADDLWPHLRDPVLRGRLAQNVEASGDLVASWTQIFGLRRLPGLPLLGLAEAELLYEAGLRSAADLLQWEAGPLAKLLVDLNTAWKLTDHPPDDATVAAWIESQGP